MTHQSPISFPIFIVGYMHPGTTLLQNIFKRHSQVFAGSGETKFFDFLPNFRHLFPNLDNKYTRDEYLHLLHKIVHVGLNLGDLKRNPQFNIEQCGLQEKELLIYLQEEHDHVTAFWRTYAFLAQRENKTHWLEKTPTHVFYIKQIIQNIPNARVVEIVRDPRSILASKKSRLESVWTDRYKPEQQLAKHWEKAYDPLWDTLSWRSAIASGIQSKRLFPDRIITVRYEDLVTNPSEKIIDICAFLGLPFEEHMLQVSKGNTAYWKETKNQGISNTSVNKWQGILTPGEIEIAQLNARQEMQAYNYSFIPVGRKGYLQASSIFLKSSLSFIRRLYHRYKMGGLPFLVFILTSYWKRFLKLWFPMRTS